MRLIVNNLGSIKNNNQSIDLSKRFYVFVGKNNSGKTYFTQLLWTLINQETINDFAEKYQDTEDFNKLEQKTNYEFTVTRPYVNILLKKLANFLKLKLVEAFNTKHNSPVFNNISIKFSFNIAEIDEPAFKSVYSIIRGSKNERVEYLTITKPPKSRIVSFSEEELPQDFFDDIPKNYFNKDIKKEKHKTLVRTILHVLLGHKHDTFFLPANRLFYSSFYQYIYQIERNRREEDRKIFFSLLEEIESNDNTNKTKINSLDEKIKGFRKSYTEPINEIFSRLYSLNIEEKQTSYYPELLEQLAVIMGGSISINSIEGISPIDFYFHIKKEIEKLPMYLASSSVNQLTLLYLYLKYWANENNNFLMIDEPEENLYLENQIALLDILIKFSNIKNNKVLVTTHSPLIADIVNSYLYLGVLKKKYNCDIEEIIKKENLNYLNPTTFIEKDEIGVYFFEGSRIIDYEAEEYGIYFRNFKEINEFVAQGNKILTDYIYTQDCDNE